MLENTPFPCDETQNAYAFGAAAAEMLVAVKGQEAMNNFYEVSAATGDWRKSFESAFGIKVPNFYEKLAAYISSQFRMEFVESPTLTPSPTPVVTPTPTPTPTPIATQSVAPTPTVIAPAPVAKKITITCIKGKATKKIKGVKPKCPKGYKKK